MSSDIVYSIIVPAFNEEEVIEGFIARLREVLKDVKDAYEIIVVNDGSADNTYSVASAIEGIKVLNHPYNKGNGAAVKTGIMESRGKKLFIIDSDGQHDPKHIPEMMKLLETYDLVVGARDAFGVSRRGFGNALVSRLASYLSGIEIPDLTSGFRGFEKEKMLQFIDLLPNGFSLPSTSTLAFATNGYNVKFITINADARQGGQSSINVSMDGVKFIILIVRMISLFKPMKFFAPVSISLFALSLLWSIKTIAYTGGLSPTVAMLFMAAIFTFLFGLLADQIAETRSSIGKITRHLMKDRNKEIE